MSIKQVSNNQQAFTLGESTFVGLDTYTAPNKLQDGFFQNLYNVQIYGNSIIPRNGWNTCWQSTTGNANYTLGTSSPIYEPTALRHSGTKSKIVFTCNNKLYYWDPTTYQVLDGKPVELLDRNTGASFAFPDSANVRFQSFGRYLYGCAGGSHPLFRVRMNGSTVEAETVPQLDDVTSVVPIATAMPMTVKAIDKTTASVIDTTGFGSAPSTLTSVVTNGDFSSSNNTVINGWMYNNTDVEYITATSSGPNYYFFNVGVKNADKLILTRTNTAGSCVKVDKVQDVIYQDIDVRNVLITCDETPMQFTASAGTLITVPTGHGLSIGQIIRFETTTGGVSTSINYYVKTVPSNLTFTFTSDSTLAAAATAVTVVTLGQNRIIPQHNAGLYALTFYLYNQDDLTNFVSGNTIDVYVRGYEKTTSGVAFGSTRLDGAEVYFSAQAAAATNSLDWQKFQILVDFRQFDKKLTGIQIRFSPAFYRGGNSFVLIDDVYLHAINSRFQIADPQDDSKNLLKLVANQANPTFVSDTLPTDPFVNQVANEYIKINIDSTGLDLRQVNSISVKASFSEKINQSVPPFSLGIRYNNKMEFTGQCSYDKDNGFLTFQLFPISAEARKSVTVIYLKMDYDLLGFTNNEWVISIGDVTKEGALTPGSKYSYSVTLWRPYTLPTAGSWPTPPELPSGSGMETLPTKASNEVVTTAAISNVKLAIPYSSTQLKQGTSGSTSKYKYALIYRRNVLTGDNRFRLIGFVDLDTGLTYTSGNTWVGLTSSDVTDTVSGTSTTQLTLIDQVPDSSLFYDNGPGTRGYRQRIGKDQYPLGIDCLAVYNQRLFGSKLNTIYASWSIDTNNEFAIYTTLVPDPTDAETSIKGSSFSLSNQTDSDQIVEMMPVQGDGLMRDNSTSAALVIMREKTTYLLTGDSPHNFANQGFLQEPGSGLIAKRGAAILMNKLVYTTPNGIMQLNSTTLSPIGLQLEGLLNIRSADYANGSSSYISAALYSKISMTVYDRRLFVFAPIANDATPCSRIYVFDTRNNGWTNWVNPSGVGFTGGVAIESPSDTQEFYAAGTDGRMYKLENFADAVYKETTSVNRTLTPIWWQIKTRKYGQTYAEGAMYYSANKLHNIMLHASNFSASNTFTVNWSLTGTKTYTSSGSYTFPQAISSTVPFEKVVSVRSVSRMADQQNFDITLSGTTSEKWKMFAFHVVSTEGNTPRS